MTDPIEPLLQECGFKYTKEFDPSGASTYCLPFDSPQGTILVRLLVNSAVFSAYTFLRALDSIAVPSSKKSLFLDLLKLNAENRLARVGLWSFQDDETEWIMVVADTLPENLNANLVRALIQETVSLAELVLQAIAKHALPQKQLK